MSPSAIFLSVVATVVVAVVAAYLIKVILILRHAVDTLGKVIFGVRSISHRTEPIGAAVDKINSDLAAVAAGLESVAAKLGPAQPTRRAS